jgi:hypothetical protein
MAFIVNSSPGAGLRFEPSATFADAKTALNHARRLALRGMRSIKVRESESGVIHDMESLQRHISGVDSDGRKE